MKSLSLALLLAFAGAYESTVFAASLSPGDIVIAVQNGGALYRIDPNTGDSSLITQGGLLDVPTQLIIDSQGNILTAERNVDVGIVRTNPTTGEQVSVVSDPRLDYPVAVAFDGNSGLVIGNTSFETGFRIFHHDDHTGSLTSFPDFYGLKGIQDLDVDRFGRTVISEPGSFGSGGRISRFDPVSNLRSVIVYGGEQFHPVNLAINSTGDYIVSSLIGPNTSRIYEVDPATGDRRTLASLPGSGFIALRDDSTAYYTATSYWDAGEWRSNLFEVNLISGQSRIIAPISSQVVGIAVYLPVPEPTGALLGVLGLLYCWRRRS